MQDTPLLEKLDWIFTSAEWISTFPNTLATPMTSISSDHLPILISIGSDIPKSQISQFEEYWLDFEGLDDVVSEHWLLLAKPTNSAVDIPARLKSLRKGIKNGVGICLTLAN